MGEERSHKVMDESNLILFNTIASHRENDVAQRILEDGVLSTRALATVEPSKNSPGPKGARQ